MLPAFVNAHTHLDLSICDGPLGYQGMSLPEWLIGIIQVRRQNTAAGSTDAVHRGIRDCQTFGSSLIGNIAGTPWQSTEPSGGDPAIVDFFEQLGADSNQADAKHALLEKHLDQPGQLRPAGNAMVGISPHAPYSISVQLFDLTIDLALSRNLPVAMHLAESMEERQFLDNRSGPFREVLAAAGIDPEKTELPTIRHCLHRMSECESAIVVHGNYLTDSELDLIAENSARLSVVWCPRTHGWFGHSPWPVRKMLQRGICVAIGTDSRASNPDLDVLAELQAIAKSESSLAPRTILQMGTLNGVRALRGNLTDDRRVPLVMLQYADEIPDDPESAVLSLIPEKRTLWKLSHAQSQKNGPAIRP